MSRAQPSNGSEIREPDAAPRASAVGAYLRIRELPSTPAQRRRAAQALAELERERLVKLRGEPLSPEVLARRAAQARADARRRGREAAAKDAAEGAAEAERHAGARTPALRYAR